LKRQGKKKMTKNSTLVELGNGLSLSAAVLHVAYASAAVLIVFVVCFLVRAWSLYKKKIERVSKIRLGRSPTDDNEEHEHATLELPREAAPEDSSEDEKDRM
jgi:hypothetical protein